MLVLSRKVGEALWIGPRVRLRVVSVSGNHVRLAFEAPDDVGIHREEVLERVARANQEAVGAPPAREGAEARGGSDGRP